MSKSYKDIKKRVIKQLKKEAKKEKMDYYYN